MTPKIKTFVILAAILLALSRPGMANDDGESVDSALIGKVEKRFSEINGFKAKFKQIFHNASMGTVEESEGVVAMKKPLKMRWEYKTPSEQTVLSDGKAVCIYVPAEKRAITEPLGNVINDRSPALFLAGGKKLRDIFVIKPAQPGDEIGKMDGKIFLSLAPREKSASVTRIVVAVDAEDYTIRALSFYDWAGNRSDMEFSGMEINGKINAEQFVFKRPRGVELLDSPKF
jgi:outer membrane lipoprotein carrier protein